MVAAARSVGLKNGSHFVLAKPGDVAESLCNEYDLQAVMIIGIRKDGYATVMTSAETPKGNAALEMWCRDLIQSHMSIVPFGTLFGFANGGRPVLLTPDQKYRALAATPKYRAFIEC